MKHTNKKVTGTNLFILRSSVEKVVTETNRLSYLASQFYFARNYNAVISIADQLLNLPGKAESLGQYYLALSLSRQGAAGREFAYKTLCQLADSPDPIIRSGAHLRLASHAKLKNFDEAIHLAKIANRLSLSQDWCAPLVTAQAQNFIGVLLSLEGAHQNSLEVFSNNLILSKHLGSSYPTLYFDTLNSCAIELSEGGQYDYAQHLIKKVAASPYYSLYPEWQETYAEIAQAPQPSRSFVGGLPAIPNYINESKMTTWYEKIVEISAYIKEKGKSEEA